MTSEPSEQTTQSSKSRRTRGQKEGRDGSTTVSKDGSGRGGGGYSAARGRGNGGQKNRGASIATTTPGAVGADTDAADETEKSRRNGNAKQLNRRPGRGRSGGRSNGAGDGGSQSGSRPTNSRSYPHTQSGNESNADNTKVNNRNQRRNENDGSRQRAPNSSNNNANRNNSSGKQRSNKSRTKKISYEPHTTLESCLQRYSANDHTIIRGKLRVMAGRHGASFVTCDRGSQLKDVLVKDEQGRNRGMDGNFVFVELHPSLGGGEDEAGNGAGEKKHDGKVRSVADFMGNLELNDTAACSGSKQMAEEMAEGEDKLEDLKDIQCEEQAYLVREKEEEEEASVQKENTESIVEEEVEMWQDDEVQMRLWDPVLNLRKRSKKSTTNENETLVEQKIGRVIFILPPKSNAGQLPSELTPVDESRRNDKQNLPKRTIVGTLTQLPNGGRVLLSPNNRSLPQFMCPSGIKVEGSSNSHGTGKNNDEITDGNASKTLYKAEYTYDSWHATNKWPPCTNVSHLCSTGNVVQDETQALLIEHGVDHGDFSPAVLREVEHSVKSGRFFEKGEMGWKPTEELCQGRRDYRNHRVFTIDPTTAKDLDDALHITPLPDGRVEIGVHIADVSHFIQPKTAVDEEALKRATTVYLVNDVIPMLPRPLCEIACSLNENVERLAFSCVWRMNMDGTLGKRGGDKGTPAEDDIWYGRTVIKSCARLDYATAQNIIDGKVAKGEVTEEGIPVDEAYWPKSRQPTGGHTIDQVAADVRLMHKVAMARRKLRFDNGALALNGIKLAFQLEEDGETPKLCAPYPIRDSNRLIEEFMLLANYLVAQRLITHAHGRALLRMHPPPFEGGMQEVVDVSKESFNFDIDTTDSLTLQASLSRLTRECDDELVVQCITESLMSPMQPAVYIAAGEEVDWEHFALNIPYYTHFTSPIRRYPDVIVHRLLQATLDDEVDDFPQKQAEIHSSAGHCNDMRDAARKAQERSDRVFLSFYLKNNPIESTLGVCLGVGVKSCTVFVPSLGMSTKVFLQEHEDEFVINAFEDENHGGKRRIVVSPKTDVVPGMHADTNRGGPTWKSLDICVFAKLEVACTCRMQPPIDVRVKVIGPWTG